ncbi:phage baseplate assembly protein domain-containing protein [Methylovulum psychrotolerans]|uniref:phage baseplate assembly protein domain-containing protein n=1 Tax=Methylovulum psychrotolerans TaxID=1704499 RepID=UPI000CDF25B0|nr:phage baseplate assembly protein [Methylovulum psychrotolerans]
MINQIWNRLQLIFATGNITLITGRKAQATVLDEEVLDNVKLVTPFGFSHAPKKGSQAYILFPSGDRTFGVAIVVGDNSYAMELAEGEVALNDDKGNFVQIKADGSVVLKSSVSVTIDAPSLAVNGNITATGTITGG